MQAVMAGIALGAIIGSIFLVAAGVLILAYMDYHNKRFLEGERKRFRELKTFILSMGHDFKAPLSRISGLADLGKMNPSESYYELIQKMGNDMNILLDEVIHIVGVDEEIREKTEIDFEKLINAILDNFKETPEYKEVTVKKNIELHRPFYSDQWLVNTILYNLISNAFKYRRKHYIASFIDIGISTWKGWLIISVSDNGIGIPKEQQNKIFDFRKRATTQAHGLGLGLFIVQNAVEKLDGAIDIESEEGKGTAFKIYLPAGKTI